MFACLRSCCHCHHLLQKLAFNQSTRRWANLTNSRLRILCCFCTQLPPVSFLILRFRALTLACKTIFNNDISSSSFSSFAHSNRSGGRGKGQEMNNDRERSGGQNRCSWSTIDTNFAAYGH
ncbi:hypothetical protein HRI_000074000 [Hibiscus trionum]|uniref:Uncharacterized protein n=1 Tax=Hibiscus trionum TaxID=183268 RepID=A0A9W7GS35_HIBTR|nr:hypothetical protein HRI_000074000 [Hibiscus trionum]